MNTKEKELIAIAVSVAAGCEPCTQHHVKAAKEAGANPDELRKMVDTALTVRERATQRMSGIARGELGIPAEFPSCGCSAPPSQLEALASAASALAANCGSGVQGFLSAAIAAGASERDGEVALGIARQIKKVAAEKADQAAEGNGSCSETRSCCSAVTQEGSRSCC